MTNEEMDRAIAEHVGWSGIRMSNVWEITDPPEDGVVLCGHRPDGKLRAVPRYSTDLNAMHKAEQNLFARHHDARDIFIDRLCRIMDPVNGYRKQGGIDIIDATAEQHAQAFIETIQSIKTT